MEINVDVIDDSLLAGPALRLISTARQLPFTIRRASGNWVDYATHMESAAQVAVLRAELRDHVPTVLKVRALTRLGTDVIVLADTPHVSHIERLLEAGACDVLTRQSKLEDIIQDILTPTHNMKTRTHNQNPVRLSDRELQIAYLYAGPTALSTTRIALLLDLPISSVRTHLQRARHALAATGTTSTRHQLHQQLHIEGWIGI